MGVLHFHAANEADTRRLGEALATLLPPGTVVALHGTLGAGKTCLVRCVACACGIPAPDVVSPTFVLVQEYRGSRHLVHVDAYRLRDEDEFEQLGVTEFFGGKTLAFIEWAEKVGRSLPARRLDVTIEVTGAESRSFRVTGTGPVLEELIGQLALALGADRNPGAF